jgi:hypothetical protein
MASLCALAHILEESIQITGRPALRDMCGGRRRDEEAGEGTGLNLAAMTAGGRDERRRFLGEAYLFRS